MRKTAHKPAQGKDDLHSALHEAGKLLTLGLKQLEQARLDNDCHMQQLIQAHTHLTDYLADDHPDIHHSMQDMVIAFQGHDELNQRLEHVAWLLEQLSATLGTPEQITTPALNEIETQIERLYTTTTERIVHRHHRNGTNVSDSGSHCPAPNGGAIELF